MTTKTKILVVEDESIVARDIRNMLLGLGYEVVGVVPSGEEAVALAEESEPSLALVDVMLQGEMTGVEAADFIYSGFNIPVVYLTAYADESTLQRAKLTEPFGYLLKPFEERELQTTVEIALYKFKMEMKLRNRERWLTTILQSVGDGVVATDEKGCIQFMNPFAEDLTGWSQDEVLGKSLQDVFHALDEETRKPLTLPSEKILRSEEVKIVSEVLLRSKAGRDAHVHQNAAPIRAESGEISGIVLAFSDITRSKLAEEELKKSWERQKSAMEGTVQAMATHRPYRAALTIEAALDEVESNQGTKYDGQVVDACLKVFKNKKFDFETL